MCKYSELINKALRSTPSRQTGKLTDAILRALIEANIQTILGDAPFFEARDYERRYLLEISAHRKSIWLRETLAREIRDGKIKVVEGGSPPLDCQVKYRGRLLLNAESELRSGPKARIPDLMKLTESMELPIVSFFAIRLYSGVRIEKAFDGLRSYTRLRPEPFLFCAITWPKNQTLDFARVHLMLTCGNEIIGDLRPRD
jgi:hypothetical protein